jgi:signal transduction histidine kinase
MSEIRSPRPVVVAGVIIAMSALNTVSLWGRTGGPLLVTDAAIAVVSVLLAVAQLWWPVSGALAVTLLAAVSPTATPAATVGALQVAQRRRLPVAVAVAAVGIAAHVVRGLWRPPSGLSLGWWLLLIGVSYGALLGWGGLARSRRELLISLHERARRAEAEQGRRVAEARMAERHTLAWEMHDVLAHRLSLLATYAGALEYRPDSSPEQLTRAAGVVRTGVHQALEELRQVIGLLREEENEDDDLRPQPTLADLPDLVTEARGAGQTVRLCEEAGDVTTLTPTVTRTAYRVAQEGLTNARKHAPGRPVDVLLGGTPGADLLIDIRNPALGAESSPLVPGSGVGLVGLTERVRLAGGQLDHEIVEGEFRLHASLPWPRDPRTPRRR